jgi:NAD(P)-dependent dehydrogenase (short-subunit alcohol dehydrogenase family)
MLIDFRDKIVLIAGGTGGLGRAVTLAFLAERAKVTVTYRNELPFAALKATAGSAVGSLNGIAADLKDETSAAKVIQEIIAKYGRLDVVVNAIGGFAGGTKLTETSAKTFDQMLEMNLCSGFALAHASIPVMLKQREGVLINVASKAAVDHGAGVSAYAASKAAAVAIMDSLAAEVKGSGVRVNSVLPSIIDTEANRKAMPDAPFATWPKPEEIAEVILFLASDNARLIHGASIPVYGNT